MAEEGSDKEGEDTALLRMHAAAYKGFSQYPDSEIYMTLPSVRSVGHVLRVLRKLHSKFGSVILIQKHYYHDIL
jgi:hypothetical protein